MLDQTGITEKGNTQKGKTEKDCKLQPESLRKERIRKERVRMAFGFNWNFSERKDSERLLAPTRINQKGKTRKG
jgi:hypothetical protein